MTKERKTYEHMKKTRRSQSERGSKLHLCMRHSKRKHNGESSIESMVYVSLLLEGTFWPCHSTMSFVRPLDSRWVVMRRIINSRTRKWMFIRSLEFHLWVIPWITYLGSSNLQLLIWWWTQERQRWAFIKYSIEQIGQLLALQSIRFTQKKQPYISVKYNVSVLRISFSIPMSPWTFLFSSILTQLSLTRPPWATPKKLF